MNHPEIKVDGFPEIFEPSTKAYIRQMAENIHRHPNATTLVFHLLEIARTYDSTKQTSLQTNA